MSNFIPYIAALIVSAIAGLTLTTIAFEKINQSVQKEIRNFVEGTKLGEDHFIVATIKENKNKKLRIIEFGELIVIAFFAVAEIIVVPSFFNALLLEFSSSTATSLLTAANNLSFISISYISLIAGFAISAIVYSLAKISNLSSLPPIFYEESDERRKVREKIPKSA